MSRSWTSEVTSSAVRGVAVLVIGAERYLLAIRPAPTLTRMRVRCALIVALLALGACGSSSGKTSVPEGTTGSASPARCGPSGARTLAVDHAARVYQSGGNVYGCTAGTRHAYLLGADARSIREARAGPIALAGRVVAYGFTWFGVDTVTATVIVRDLGDGKQLRTEPATTGPLHPEFTQFVGSIVVKPDGAVAWIGEGGSVISGASEVEVDRADKHGLARLDSGGAIDVRSLRLVGSKLAWRHGSQARSASLD
jgi:hypothetical protein